MLLLSRPQIETLEENDLRGRFLIGPLDRGFGHTLGNSLRRVLLSSIPGAAVSTIELDGAIHEFSVIEGIAEDVSEIILNFKDLVLKLPEDLTEIKVEVEVNGPADVTGAILSDSPDLEVINPDLHLATVSSGFTFSGLITVSRGKGYKQAGSAGPDSTEGVIHIDAIYSPVRRVTFSVEETSSGEDQLILDVTTDQTVTPSQAVASAASTLISLLGVVEGISEEFPQVEVEPTAALISTSDGMDNRPIEELRLSERAQNCLRRAQINTIGELVTRTSKDLLKITNFGDKSLDEVKEALTAMGLSLVGDLGVASFGEGGAAAGMDEEYIGGYSTDMDSGAGYDGSELDEEEEFLGDKS